VDLGTGLDKWGKFAPLSHTWVQTQNHPVLSDSLHRLTYADHRTSGFFHHEATAPFLPQWARATSLSRVHDHTQPHHTRKDSSGLVISSSQRALPEQHTTLTTDRHTSGGIRTRNPSKREAADQRFRQGGQWVGLDFILIQHGLNLLILIMDHKCTYFNVPRHKAVMWAIKYGTNVACMVGPQNIRIFVPVY
jgi:hypothetical protein